MKGQKKSWKEKQGEAGQRAKERGKVRTGAEVIKGCCLQYNCRDNLSCVFVNSAHCKVCMAIMETKLRNVNKLKKISTYHARLQESRKGI